MPHVRHDATGRQRIVPSHALPAYRSQDWSLADYDAPPGQASGGAGAPAVSASKAEWVDYAVEQGYPRSWAQEMTKTDLVEALG